MRDFREALKRRPDLKLYVLLDYPWTEAFNGHQGDTDPLRHVPRWRNVDQIIVPYPKSDRWKRGNEVVLKGLSACAEFIDPTGYICPGEKCNLLKWYKDDDHLQAKSLLREAVWLDAVFN